MEASDEDGVVDRDVFHVEAEVGGCWSESLGQKGMKKGGTCDGVRWHGMARTGREWDKNTERQKGANKGGCSRKTYRRDSNSKTRSNRHEIHESMWTTERAHKVDLRACRAGVASCGEKYRGRA